MFSIGDKVIVSLWNDDGTKREFKATVTGTFYEPGDPVQGISVVDRDGQPHGSLCSSWARPDPEEDDPVFKTEDDVEDDDEEYVDDDSYDEYPDEGYFDPFEQVGG